MDVISQTNVYKMQLTKQLNYSLFARASFPLPVVQNYK